MEFREGFFGFEVVYTFNSYVLLDHSPQELANDPNPFAAVVEAAWQYLKRPKDEQKLAQLKLYMIKRLLKRNLPKNQVKAIISFITLYVDFKNPTIWRVVLPLPHLLKKCLQQCTTLLVQHPIFQRSFRVQQLFPNPHKSALVIPGTIH